LNDGKVVAEVTNSSGSFECAADMTRLGGERVRFTAYGWCDATYDFVWRLDGDVLYSVTVDSAALDSWTNQDWLNRQAWNKIPHVRID
jgi:hypothetical protein